jgi:hypothetical protein
VLFVQGFFIFFAGGVDANSSGYRDGVCCWRRAVRADLQCWTIQRRRGFFFFFLFLLLNKKMLNKFDFLFIFRRGIFFSSLFLELVTATLW